MDYSTYDGLQLLLFGGAALALGVWQVRAVQRLRRQRVVVRPQQRLRIRPKARFRGNF